MIFSFMSMFSFKLNLIQISHFHQSRRFQGDYSAQNWKVFSRFCLAFICLPYPLIIFASAYFIHSNSIFSYAGFAAIEVIAVSTVSSLLMFFDAVNSLRCSSKPVQPDVPLPDEEEPIHILKRKRQQKETCEFGNDHLVNSEPATLSKQQTQQQL